MAPSPHDWREEFGVWRGIKANRAAHRWGRIALTDSSGARGGEIGPGAPQSRALRAHALLDGKY
eukprot:scaffold274463_cov21-Tisochrysis_lutea.AAC.1